MNPGGERDVQRGADGCRREVREKCNKSHPSPAFCCEGVDDAMWLDGGSLKKYYTPHRR